MYFKVNSSQLYMKLVYISIYVINAVSLNRLCVYNLVINICLDDLRVCCDRLFVSGPLTTMYVHV